MPRLVSDREWGELTVVIATQRAELRYAREPVGWAKLILYARDILPLYPA